MSPFAANRSSALLNKVSLEEPIKQAGIVMALDVVVLLIAFFGIKYFPTSVAESIRSIMLLAHLILGAVGAVFLRRILIGLQMNTVGTLVLYVVTIFICFPAQWIVLGTYLYKGQQAMQPSRQ